MSASIALNPNSSSGATKTYLNFCEEQLDPALISSYTQESHGFANSAMIRAVAYPIMAAVAFITTTIYAPIFTIIIGFSSILLLSHVKKVYSEFIRQSDVAQQRADQLNLINQHYQGLSNSTPGQLQQILKDKGISFVIGMQQNDPRLTSLKPLIARHLFWEGRIEELKTKQQEKLQLAKKLTERNFELNRNEIHDLQSDALEFENQALIAKVKGAFISAVIRRPDYKGTLEDLGTFSNLSGQERGIARASSAAKANDFFNFNRPGAPSIKYDEAKQNTLSQLSMHLYPNMHP